MAEKLPTVSLFALKDSFENKFVYLFNYLTRLVNSLQKIIDRLDVSETSNKTSANIQLSVSDDGVYLLNTDGSQQNVIPMTNFPVEEGVSGNWSYKKWKNGDAECWYQGEIEFSTNMDTGVGIDGFYLENADVYYPITFLSDTTPLAIASIQWSHSEWVQA